MTSVPAGSGPAGQGGQTAAPPDPAAEAAAPSGAAVPPDAAAGQARRGGWAAAAAKYAPVGIAAATMAVLGVWGLARNSSMGNDEVATRWAALLSLRDLARLLNTVDAVHGLYYLIMHVWVAVGSSPAVLRIPSVLAMVAAVALTVILARRLTGSGWAALFAGLVMALTPVISYYAQTARSYAMVVTCVLAATLALLHALDAEVTGAAGPQVARRWALYGALVTLAGYLNELSLLVLAAHGVTVLLARYGRRVLRHWAAAAAVGAMLVLPLVAVSIREDAAVHWISPPNLRGLRILFQDYFGVSYLAGVIVLACAIVAVLPPAGWWQRRRASTAAELPWWRRGGVSLPSVAAPLLVLPAALLMGESFILIPLYVDRYVLYGEAGAALLAGAGMYRIGQWLAGAAGQRKPGGAAGQRSLLWLPGVVVVVLALLLQLGPQQRARTPDSRSFNFGGPSRLVGARARPGDGVLFFGALFRKTRLGYPQDFTKTSDFAMSKSPQQAGNFQGTDKRFARVEPMMLARQRIWVIGKQPSKHLASTAFRAESLVLENNFTRILKRRFRGVVVTLWQRR